MNRLTTCFGFCALALSGCGDDETSAPPTDVSHPAIPGGGVSGAPLAGALEVHVLDGGGDPIAGAEISLGEGATARVAGVTDASGRLLVSGDDVVGTLTISATAAGSGSASVVGLQADGVTLALPPFQPVVPVEAFTLDVGGFEDLPAPQVGHRWLAQLEFARPLDLGDEVHTLPSNSVCEQTAGEAPAPCTLEPTVWEDTKALLVTVSDVVDAGTPTDPTDDTATVVFLGLATDFDLATNPVVSVDLLADTETASGAIGLPNPAAKVSAVIGVPGLGLSDQVLLYPVPPGEAVSSFAVPIADSAPDGATLWTVARGVGAGATTTVLSRGLALPNAPGSMEFGELPSFLELPTVALEAGRVVLGSSAGASLHVVDVRGGELRWIAHVLGVRDQIEPPVAISLGESPVRATSLDHPVDLPLSFQSAAESALRRASAESDPEP